MSIELNTADEEGFNYNYDEGDENRKCRNCGYDFDEEMSDAKNKNDFCSMFCEREANGEI